MIFNPVRTIQECLYSCLMNTYYVKPPQAPRIPILLSIPHCGTEFPAEIIEEYQRRLVVAPDDTDWFVDQLYDFAPSLGITVITARYSRWVIDLNRHPESKPLYTDGRIITDLCPTTTFLREPLYKDKRKEVSAEEVHRRIDLYFKPYHEKLTVLLRELKSEFGSVLLWDCHSIRQTIPTIQKDKFPDLILGSADGQSCDESLIRTATRNLQRGDYTLQHNHPFKGGYITRQFGKPETGLHALQLEMTKINYMDDQEMRFHPSRAEKMAELLNITLSDLGKTLIAGKDY